MPVKKKKSKTEQSSEMYMQICPKCKSKEVTAGMISEHAGSNVYACQTCGFQGPLFPEILASEAIKLPEQPRNFNPAYLPRTLDRTPPSRTKLLAIIAGILAIFLLILLLTK